MPAMDQIVDTYVRLGDRKSLEDMLAHRQALALNMESRADFDFGLPLKEIARDIAAIQSGIDRLQSVPQDGSEASGAGQIEPPE